jgi:ArsR family transcriptional regulator
MNTASVSGIQQLDNLASSTDLSLRVAKACRALSNPHRLMMYRRLLQQQTNEFHSCLLQDLIDQCRLGAPTISHHIKILERAHLIEVTRVGKYMRCALNPEMHAILSNFLAMPRRETRDDYS